MSHKPKTPENPYIHGKGGQHPQPCPACIWECGHESNNAEVVALQAKLLEAQAACAEMHKDICELIERWRTKAVRLDFMDSESQHAWNNLWNSIVDKSKSPNPGAHLLAQLEAADELTKYLEHNEGCALPNSYHEDRPDSCSCGLGELLKKIQKLREAK